jgi:hypothetical protein
MELKMRVEKRKSSLCRSTKSKQRKSVSYSLNAEHKSRIQINECGFYV